MHINIYTTEVLRAHAVLLSSGQEQLEDAKADAQEARQEASAAQEQMEVRRGSAQACESSVENDPSHFRDILRETFCTLCRFAVTSRRVVCFF